MNGSVLDNNQYLTMTLMGQFLGISERSVRRLIHNGRLPPPFLWNGKNYWRSELIKKFFKTLEKKQTGGL